MPVPLPPLPPFGDGPPSGPNVVDVLAAEHRRLTALCAELTDPALPDGRRRRVADVISATLTRHLSAEEQYLYPALRAVVPEGEGMGDREVAADRAILHTLRELANAPVGHAAFERCAGLVAAQVRRHAETAADEILPALLRSASVSELVRLGNRVETAEEAAPTRPHPRHPRTPPWNKVLDPAFGVLDRLRDVIARRATHPDDL